MGEYGLYCKTICEHFRNGRCCVDYEWLTQPPVCETLEWEELEEMAKEAQENEKR